MRLNEITFTDAKPVEGYGPGFFRIGGDVFHGPLIIGPSGVTAWTGYEDADALLALKDTVDVLFVGTGAETAHLPSQLRRTLEEAGLGVEVMASPAACRTYNVLLSEGRRIALALIPV
ncbi:Mth938-like domain-containing protein [Roseobacter sinensis]|uniref:Mth938-like domain-containing protein n=1 Tax=Roseobacter sinensis TaxID=2931391 RepID=A0ABT3BC82_9RHOB|nr:Mth938-like domain-containing protein [Roseobacter sp. WL0113]MCV3271192.1 Mth938-like domain-containing protein [Roseobacter sp. WL0113]